MPGTPATSPRFGAPRFSNADAVDFAGQVNGVTDAFDTNARRLSDPIAETDMAVGATGLAKGSFSAHRVAALSIATATAILFDNDSTAGIAWDVSGWYNPATGRYTPQVAGYYRLGGHITPSVSLATGKTWGLELFKNGALYRRLFVGGQYAAAPVVHAAGSAPVFANGTTDFFDLRALHDVAGSVALAVGSSFCYFYGEFVGRS